MESIESERQHAEPPPPEEAKAKSWQPILIIVAGIVVGAGILWVIWMVGEVLGGMSYRR